MCILVVVVLSALRQRNRDVHCAPILDLRLGRLLEERRASAGGLSCSEIFQSYLRVASLSLFLFSRHDQALDQRIKNPAKDFCWWDLDGVVVVVVVVVVVQW